MKGAFLLANDPALYMQVEEVLARRGGRTSKDRTVQIGDGSGVLFTVFGTVGAEAMAEVQAPPTGDRDNVGALDLQSVTVCWVECRCEETFVRWVVAIAAERENATWVLDGDGVIWSAESLDPTELVL